jgi:hypothetical protein
VTGAFGIGPQQFVLRPRYGIQYGAPSSGVVTGDSGQRIPLVMMRGEIATAIAAAVGITLTMLVDGCGASPAQPDSPGAEAVASNDATATNVGNREPQMITDLSKLTASSGNPSVNEQVLIAGAAALHDSSPGTGDAQSSVDQNLERLYLSKNNSAANGGEALAAGDRTLLNAKARAFPAFSEALLNQTLVAAQALEVKQLEQHKLPEEMRPLILTATMTPEGKLTDLAVEQHTGFGPIDRLLIEACKQGLWAANPPAGALADNGMYQLRFEGVVRNYSYDVVGNYRYVTHVGLALM